MALPVNIDSTYADSGTDASVKDHQQHHDTIHGILNGLPAGGLLASMPATGTGSGVFYFATDDNGGTLYQDRTNGGAYTKVAPGITQPSGVELFYGEITSDETSVVSVASAEVFTAVDLTYTLTAQARPVYVELACGVVSNSSATNGSALHIVGTALSGTHRAQLTSATAAAQGVCRATARLAAGATGTIQGKKSRVGAAGTASFAGSASPIYLRVWTG